MPLAEADLLAALRGDRPIADICAAAGTTEAEFALARDAWLEGKAAPRDRTLHAAVHGMVEILRDKAGVPHVFAATTADVYFGLGVAMAEDRLWQMDRLRRRALGRQAEILGPTYVASDIAHLTVDKNGVRGDEGGPCGGAAAGEPGGVAAACGGTGRAGAGVVLCDGRGAVHGG